MIFNSNFSSLCVWLIFGISRHDTYMYFNVIRWDLFAYEVIDTQLSIKSNYDTCKVPLIFREKKKIMTMRSLHLINNYSPLQ